MSQVTATTSLAYRFYESLAVFTSTVGILQSTADCMYSPRPLGKPDHNPEVADLLSVQEVAITNLLGQINFL